jgi:hypothetical protein
MLHKHRAIQRNCDFGEFQISLGTALGDKVHQCLHIVLFLLFHGDAETIQTTAAFFMLAETDHRSRVFADVNSQIILRFHYWQTPKR